MQQLLLNISKPYRVIDKRLLLHKPWLWETKLHFAVLLGTILNLIVLLYAMAFHADIVAYVDDFGVSSLGLMPFLVAILSLIGLTSWFVQVAVFRGDLANVTISKNVFRKQFLAYVASVSIFVLPIVSVILIGYTSYYFNADEKGLQWAVEQTMIEALPELIGLASTSVVLSILVQVQKSIGWKRLVQGLSIYTLATIVILMSWNISVFLGVLVTAFFSLVSFFVVIDKWLSTKISNLSHFHIFTALFAQLISPFICWTFSYGIMLLLSLLSNGVSDELVMWAAWLFGLALYTFFISPRFHLLYLRYWQLPKTS